MKRRTFLFIASCCILGLDNPTQSNSQIRPFALRLVRRTGWEELMYRNKCIIGDFYLSSPEFPKSDLGRKLRNALELPWRNNLNEISAIPQAEYRGHVRTGGKLGWRIELTGTGARTHVQVHLGNRPNDTVGCILAGTGDGNDSQCSIADSREALKKLQVEYGSSNSRSVVLLIQA